MKKALFLLFLTALLLLPDGKTVYAQEVLADMPSVTPSVTPPIKAVLTYDDIDGAWAIPGPYLTIHRMAMDNAHRGQGLAGQIIANAIELARQNGCAALRVDTHTGNRAMRRFLEKQGFVYRGTVLYTVKKGDPVRVAYERGI